MSVNHTSEQGNAGNASHDAAHVAASVGKYKILFVGLLLLTFVTVGVSYIDLGHLGNMLLGLTIATAKAALVAAVFMHLWGEKFTIWRFLIFTAIFVTGLFGLSMFAYLDPVPSTALTSHSKTWRVKESLSAVTDESDPGKVRKH